MSRSWRYFVNFYLFSLICCHLFSSISWIKTQMSAKYPQCYWTAVAAAAVCAQCSLNVVQGKTECEEKRETCIWGGHLPLFLALSFIYTIVKLLILWTVNSEQRLTQVKHKSLQMQWQILHTPIFYHYWMHLMHCMTKCCAHRYRLTFRDIIPNFWNKASKTYNSIESGNVISHVHFDLGTADLNRITNNKTAANGNQKISVSSSFFFHFGYFISSPAAHFCHLLLILIVMPL